MKKVISLTVVLITLIGQLKAQDVENKKEISKEYNGIVFDVGNNKTMKLTFLNQVWVRYSNTNPGTTVFGDPHKNIFDIGLRRTRIVLSGSPRDRVNVFVQLGMNNFNYIAERQAGFFFHDAVADYEFIDKKFYVGAGLTAWGGFSRFSSPSVGSILGVDAPLFAQATNGATDQFLRKLSIFTRGNIGKFSYKVALSKPMAIQRTSAGSNVNLNSNYSQLASKPQFHGYFEYAFLDKESHSNPYTAGTHLGKKKVLNIGVGFMYQTNGMQKLDINGDTTYPNISIFSIDVFYDAPTKNNGVVNFYAGYFNYNFGKGYLRNIGAMNPANGNNNPLIVNGGGTAFPMIGTGNIGYVQGGYMLPDKNGTKKTRLMPYASGMFANYDALQDIMIYYDLGLNIFIHGHSTKLTLAYQNRPIFITNTNNKNVFSQRKSCLITQLQVTF